MSFPCVIHALSSVTNVALFETVIFLSFHYSLDTTILQQQASEISRMETFSPQRSLKNHWAKIARKLSIPGMNLLGFRRFLSVLNPFRSAHSDATQLGQKYMDDLATDQLLNEKKEEGNSTDEISSTPAYSGSTTTQNSRTSFQSKVIEVESNKGGLAVSENPVNDLSGELRPLARENIEDDGLFKDTLAYTTVQTVTSTIYLTTTSSSMFHQCTVEPFQIKLCNELK